MVEIAPATAEVSALTGTDGRDSCAPGAGTVPTGGIARDPSTAFPAVAGARPSEADSDGGDASTGVGELDDGMEVSTIGTTAATRTS